MSADEAQARHSRRRAPVGMTDRFVCDPVSPVVSAFVPREGGRRGNLLRVRPGESCSAQRVRCACASSLRGRNSGRLRATTSVQFSPEIAAYEASSENLLQGCKQDVRCCLQRLIRGPPPSESGRREFRASRSAFVRAALAKPLPNGLDQDQRDHHDQNLPVTAASSRSLKIEPSNVARFARRAAASCARLRQKSDARIGIEDLVP